MTYYGVTEAKARLAELIDRAEKGERVVITRYGRPRVELRAVVVSPRSITQTDLTQLAEQRDAIRRRKGRPDAVDLVRRGREEDWL